MVLNLQAELKICAILSETGMSRSGPRWTSSDRDSGGVRGGIVSVAGAPIPLGRSPPVANGSRIRHRPVFVLFYWISETRDPGSRKWHCWTGTPPFLTRPSVSTIISFSRLRPGLGGLGIYCAESEKSGNQISPRAAHIQPAGGPPGVPADGAPNRQIARVETVQARNGGGVFFLKLLLRRERDRLRRSHLRHGGVPSQPEHNFDRQGRATFTRTQISASRAPLSQSFPNHTRPRGLGSFRRSPMPVEDGSGNIGIASSADLDSPFWGRRVWREGEEGGKVEEK